MDKKLSKVSLELKKRAISLGLCSEWTNDWRDSSKDSLCDMYVRGIDFCIANSYPTNEFMKDNFDGVMQNHGIFVDNKLSYGTTSVKPRTIIANGRCKGYVNYDKNSVGEIYVRHDSCLNIVVGGSSRVFVNVFDHAKVSIKMLDSMSEVVIYRYSKSCIISVVDGGNVRIKDGDASLFT